MRLSDRCAGENKSISIAVVRCSTCSNASYLRARPVASVDDFKQLLDQHAPTETRNYIERVSKRMPLYASYLAPSAEAPALASIAGLDSTAEEPTTA